MTAAEHPGPHGILLVDKPAGWTSHDVVAKARRLLHQRRIGHTGTLDPAATGLLVLCVGLATRLVEYMTAHDKRYEGEITLGVSTATDDAEGEVTARAAVPDLDDPLLRRLEQQFIGEILQRPPAFSAVQVGGQRAYAMARKGTPVQLAERRIQVQEFTLGAPVSAPDGTAVVPLRVRCGPGTYIRGLARDMGTVIGCGAHLSSLRRLTVGEFNVIDSWTLPELEALSAAGLVAEALLPVDEGILANSAAVLGAESAARFGHGMFVTAEAGETPEPGLVRAYGADGEFLGTASRLADGALKPLKVLASA